jgi:hypothetical protein
MHIEDIIFSLAIGNLKTNNWDMQVISSLHAQICQQTGLTEKQCLLAIRIAKRYLNQLNTYHGKDIRPYIESPQYRLPVRKSVTSKSISIIEDDPVYGRLIEAKFPYNESTIASIRNYRNKNTSTFASWDKDRSSWMFSLTEENIMFLINTFSNSEFEYDEKFKDYATQAFDIIARMEDHVPMLAMGDDGLYIKNASSYMPALGATDDPVEAVFKSRLLGVHMWDANIDAVINDDSFDSETRKFLKSELTAVTSLKTAEGGIPCLQNIIKYLSPCLFVIPAVDELTKLEHAHSIVKDSGIDSQKMSVLFRLDSNSGSKFNDFVKNQGLNNPITEDTRIAFVSGKLPKPLIKSKIRFKSIVNLGFTNAHYTLKNYMKDHQNLVLFDVDSKQRTFDFVNM